MAATWALGGPKCQKIPKNYVNCTRKNTKKLSHIPTASSQIWCKTVLPFAFRDAAAVRHSQDSVQPSSASCYLGCRSRTEMQPTSRSAKSHCRTHVQDVWGAAVARRMASSITKSNTLPLNVLHLSMPQTHLIASCLALMYPERLRYCPKCTFPRATQTGIPGLDGYNLPRSNRGSKMELMACIYKPVVSSTQIPSGLGDM